MLVILTKTHTYKTFYKSVFINIQYITLLVNSCPGTPLCDMLCFPTFDYSHVYRLVYQFTSETVSALFMLVLNV